MRNIRKLVYTNLVKYFLLLYSNLNKPQINFFYQQCQNVFQPFSILGEAVRN